MSKVSTPLGSVSAEQMYQNLVRELLKKDSNLKARKFKFITNGEVYNSTTNETFITYHKFKEILSAYNIKAGEKIIKGYTFDLGNNLGDLFVARIERPQHGRKLDRGKSFQRRRELKAAGTLTKTNWQVPYNDDDFIMVMWHKGNGQIPNIRLYKFKSAGGQPGKGFRAKLSQSVTNNPSLKAVYPYLPNKVLPPKKEEVVNDI